MKAAELRQLSGKDLSSKIAELEESLFRIRCNRTLGQIEDTTAITKTRRAVARAKTVLKEKQSAEKGA